MNRPGDSGPQEHRYTLHPEPAGEEAAVQRLLAQDNAYADNLPYELEPEPDDDHYNSNSYTSGMLRAAGIAVPFCMKYYTPGFEKPIPEESFK